MRYTRKSNAVCLADIKQAALYFDHVYFVDQNEFIEKEILRKESGILVHDRYEFVSDVHKQALKP